MSGKTISIFFAGLLIGLFGATMIFSHLVRSNVGAAMPGGEGASANVRRARILKLGHGLDQNHPVHLAMEYMAERLAEKSGQTMKIEIYPNGQLGAETQCIEQLQQGALAMTKTSAAPMESFIPEMAVFGLPYIFRDEEHFWQVIESEIGKELLMLGERLGLRGLCYYDAGSRNFYTVDQPIETPGDMEGLKIRVQKSKSAMDMVDVLGGKATPLPWGELYTALQQGMVDGAENNPPSFYTNRHYEVCKHFSLNEHTFVPDILLISKQIWDQLTSEQQNWLQEAVDESQVYQKRLWNKMTQEAIDAVSEKGVKIYYPDKKPFAEKVKPMYEDYRGVPAGTYMNRILEMK